jgi:bifunctional non-homologous end joining protein LigD
MVLPAFGIAPMKAVVADVLPTDAGWAFEVKWDGYRALAFVDHGSVRFQSTRLLDLTARWPELAGLPGAVNAPSAVLDGEVVAVDASGVPRFQLLQNHAVPVTYVVFDVLAIAGLATVELPYQERRRLLEQLVEPGARWLVNASQVGDGDALLAATAARGLEGVVAKRLDSPYLVGKRSSAWRKVKHRNVQEFVVGGWLPGSGARARTFGSILVGVHDDAGALRYAGAVGSGFDERGLRDAQRRFGELARPGAPFVPPPPAEVRRVARWCRPELVAQVAFGEWTDEGILRHPVFLGWRDDVDPAAVRRESPP